ncbi:hypothetical protein [Sphingomonas sanxanigenens]|uniref:Uncharacterized protein n=1 Tax=Sphingomonas sanxanigenens DSM 19645 = NX02 TaxID=1123269 RepID=W0AJN4_9SPHN|nr:hypothetical protein [Sphingomonas sanxanigenens]AHE55885.1 hypothetical protein NX02_21245 [Sphingomonas sanxanigenens DSM 19645 = NX02]
MSLNKIITEATEAHEVDGVINRQAAINTVVPQVLADQEMTELCVRSHVSKAIASNVRSRSRASAHADPREMSFFGLDDRHVIDGEENDAKRASDLKRTEALTRIEFAGLIRRRQESVNADLAYLAKLRNAERVTRDIWDRHPDWRWGEVERAHALRQRAA